MALDRLDDFRRELDHLGTTFHCPVYEPRMFGDPGDERVRQLASDDHVRRHPARRDCAAAIVGALHHLDFQLRRRGWRVRSEANAVSQAIWNQIMLMERAFDLSPTPYWTLDQVIAGGPGYERRWPGYSGG